MIRQGKGRIGVAVIVLAIAAGVPPAAAQIVGFPLWARERPRDDGKASDRYGRRDSDQRSVNPPAGGRGEPRPQRLSPEERQQLRRDIKDAGREIYPPRR